MALQEGFYVCESELCLDESFPSCGFSFQDGLSEEEIKEAAKERIKKLGERV